MVEEVGLVLSSTERYTVYLPLKELSVQRVGLWFVKDFAAVAFILLLIRRHTYCKIFWSRWVCPKNMHLRFRV